LLKYFLLFLVSIKHEPESYEHPPSRSLSPIPERHHLVGLEDEDDEAEDMVIMHPADHRQVIVTPLLDHVGLAESVLNDERSVRINANLPSPSSIHQRQQQQSAAAGATSGNRALLNTASISCK
jgi:hypothetical protein